MHLTQSAGNVSDRVTIDFGFTSDFRKKWFEFLFKPIVSRIKANPMKPFLTVSLNLFFLEYNFLYENEFDLQDI